MSKYAIYCFMYFLEGIIAYYYFSQAFRLIVKKSSLIVSLFIAYSFQIWIFSFNIIALNLLAFTVLNFFLIYFLYSSTVISATIHSLIMTVCMGLSEIIISNLFGGLLAHYKDAAEMALYLSLTFIILNKTIYFLSLFIIVTFIAKSPHEYNKINKYSILIVVTTLISFAIFSCLALVCFHNILTESSQHIVNWASLLLLSQNCLIVWIFDYHQRQSDTIVQLELEQQRISDAKQYNSLMEHQAEQLKILRHDIKNHLITIHTLYESGAYEQANNYVNELLHTEALTHFFQPTNCDTLNLILARYCNLCREHNIQIQVNAQNSDLNFLKSEDITSLFCNLLDNAYESAIHCENAFIDVKISSSKDDYKTIISLVNSCDTPPVSDSNNNFLSSKTDFKNHGLGQKSIRRVVRVYRGKIDSYYSESEKAFHIVLFICSQQEGITL